jgi:hypothetical protein
VKSNLKLAVEGLNIILPLLKDNNSNFRINAYKALGEIVKYDTIQDVEGLGLISP